MFVYFVICTNVLDFDRFYLNVFIDSYIKYMFISLLNSYTYCDQLIKRICMIKREFLWDSHGIVLCLTGTTIKGIFSQNKNQSSYYLNVFS